uniref:ARAD1D44154p n=1 Tax=Blastobotrys adeninivorans TaxID=409370 RepID=A0A060TDI4_BLAAD
MVSLRTSATNSAPLFAPGSDAPSEEVLVSAGGASLAIALAEPTLFVCGFSASEHNQQPPVMLRGSLILRLSKSAKIKNVTLTFKGVARTEWPEGIPPKRTENYEMKDIHSHVWPFFNASFPQAEHSSGAHIVKLANSSSQASGTASASNNSNNLHPSSSGDFRSPQRGNTWDSVTSTSGENTPPAGVNASSSGTGISMKLLASKLRRTASPSPSRPPSIMSTNLSPSPSTISLHDNPLHPDHSGSSTHVYDDEQDTTHRGYRVFQPGEYVYNFELPIPHSLPETISAAYGSIKYSLEAHVERAGAFKTNLNGHKPVKIVRTESHNSVELSEPIAINRDWEDQLRYEIAIAGKAFPIGSKIPLALRMTPFAKVRCHRFRIYVTENSEYYCKNKKVHRIEPTRKFLIKEVLPDDGLQGTLLDYQGEDLNASTELEYNVEVPKSVGRLVLHPNHHSDTIEVHHWLKMVLRLSKVDENNAEKRRYFEIAIDTPITLLHELSTTQNTSLPEYSSGRRMPIRAPSLVGVPLPGSSNGIEEDYYDRPIHLIRMPSAAPPPFTETVEDGPPHYEEVLQEQKEEEEHRLRYLRVGHRISHRETNSVNNSARSSVTSLAEVVGESSSRPAASTSGTAPSSAGESAIPSHNSSVSTPDPSLAAQFRQFSFRSRSQSPSGPPIDQHLVREVPIAPNDNSNSSLSLDAPVTSGAGKNEGSSQHHPSTSSSGSSRNDQEGSEPIPLTEDRGRARQRPTREQSERDITDMLRGSIASKRSAKGGVNDEEDDEVDDEFAGGDLASVGVPTFRVDSVTARPLLADESRRRSELKDNELLGPGHQVEDRNRSSSTIDELRDSRAQSVQSLWIT